MNSNICQVPAGILAAAGLPAHLRLTVPSQDRQGERACALALASTTIPGPAVVSPPLTAALAADVGMASGLPSDFEGLKISALMAGMRAAGMGDDIFARLGSPAWDRSRTVSTAFALAHVMGPGGSWPPALYRPVRRFLAGARGMAVPGVPFTRVMLLPWHARRDVQAEFPLDDVARRAAYLIWLLTQGLHDLRIGLEQLDPRLLAWLSRPSPRLRRLPMLLEVLWLARPDLRHGFDVASDAGQDQLFQWSIAHFDASYGTTGLAAVTPSRYADLTRLFGRIAGATWLQSFQS